MGDIKHKNTVMREVREYVDNHNVRLVEVYGRLVIHAMNECGEEYGCNFTQVDLIDVLSWVKANRPELLAAAP